jgi:putative ABC transport system substrate-binding protein
MRRREFIALLGSTASVWPLKVDAQQQPRILAIVGHTASDYGPWAAALVERLGQLGWIDGRTIQIKYRWSEGRPERVRQKVDVIVTYGGAAAILKQATTSIPIVFAPAVDPLGIGLVASLSHPGGNVTGLSVQQAEVASKRLELLREIVPGLRKLAILFDATYPASAREADNVQSSARQLGLAVTPLGVRSPDDIAPAFDAFKGRVDAVYLVESAVISSHRARIIALALGAKIANHEHNKRIRESRGSCVLRTKLPGFVSARCGDR